MKQFFLASILSFAIAHTAISQTVSDYLSSINVEYDKVSKATWSYTRTAAHSSSFRRIENKRKKLLKSTKEAGEKIKKMKGWNGNTAYRDSIVSYFEISYNVINDDYAKLMDLEDVKEQSYDAMEAYMLAEKIANEKLDQANEVVQNEQKKFCEANNVNLVADDSELSKKMKTANKVYEYYNEIYLIFFKANVQETYLMNAINKQDIAAIEQVKNSLAQFSKEGLVKMANIKAFKGDNSVKTTTIKMLTFYQKEAEEDVQVYLDFFIAQEKFNKLTKAIEKKKKRTQEDVDEYNAELKKFQKLTDKFNAVNAKLNTTRSSSLEQWNSKAKRFIDKHVPK